MELQDLIKLFNDTNEEFIKSEKDLILSNVSERSWYSRFSFYLEKNIKELGLKNYYTDTEYNRNDGRLKTIFDNNNLEVIPITCDIILHSRGKNKENDNLICIEMKKSIRTTIDKEMDRKRIILLTKKSYDNVWSCDGKTLPKHVCGYKLGIYYEIDIRNRIIILEYYKDGYLFFDDKIKF